MHGKTFFLERKKKAFEMKDKLCPQAAGVTLATEALAAEGGRLKNRVEMVTARERGGRVAGRGAP
jgi:hypothetical protein